MSIFLGVIVFVVFSVGNVVLGNYKCDKENENCLRIEWKWIFFK